MKSKISVVDCIIDSKIKKNPPNPFTLLYFAATLAYASTNPFAKAIINEAEKNPKIKIKKLVKEFSEIPQEGMTGLISKNSKEDTRFYLGSKKFVMAALKLSHDCIDPRLTEFERAGKVILFFANQHKLLGYIILDYVV